MIESLEPRQLLRIVPVPGIALASDTGISPTDMITNDCSLALTGVEAGATVEYRVNSGSWSETYAPVEGTNWVEVRQRDAYNNVSPTSERLAFAWDTTAPGVPGVPDLQSGSDSGVSDADNITNDSTPTFDLSGAGPYFRFYRGTTRISGEYQTGSSYTTDSQSDGTYSFSVSAVDAAGNESSKSTALVVTIDTGIPTADVVDVSPDPRTNSVSSIAIQFSEAVYGFDQADMTLKRGGGANLLTAGQKLSGVDGIHWTLSNLNGITGTVGSYEARLTASGSGITDAAGNALAGDAADSWEVNASKFGDLLHTLEPRVTQAGSQFGFAMAADGDLTVVGAPYADNQNYPEVGRAYVFNSTTGMLVTTLENPSPTDSNDFFGYSVAISGNTVVVGAYAEDTGAVNAGSAYLFDVSTGNLLRPLNNPTPVNNDYFGYSVAISGSTVVVGAAWDNTGATDAGSAYIYDASTGNLPLTLNNPAAAASDFFGYSVAVSGNTVVVGAPDDNSGAYNAGSVYVYDATTGSLLWTLNNPTPGPSEFFGRSVAISGSTVVVGAYGDDTGATDAGSAYVFDAATGSLVWTLSNPAAAAYDRFGTSVAVSGSTVVVGAYTDDAGATDAGAAYVYDATTGSLLWTLTNPAPAEGDWFGYSVAVSGSTVVVGAYKDDAGATDAGSAYVFDATTGGCSGRSRTPRRRRVTGLGIRWRSRGAPYWWGRTRMTPAR